MPVYLKDEQLRELFLAVIFRETGYIAGIPKRHIEGRCGIHQIPFLVIEKSLVPFSYDTVLIPRYIAGDYDSQWQQVMWLSGVVRDFQQARPKGFKSLPDVRGQSAGEYFHKIYGGTRADGEFLSVEYKGLLLVADNNIFAKIKQYAYAQGLIVMYMPDVYAEKKLDAWLNIVRKKLYSSLENSALNIKGLLHHTRKIPDYRSLLKKIRKQGQQLSIEEYHDLLTILSALLKEEQLRPLLNYFRRLVIGSLGAQPVLVELNNISKAQLIIGIADYYIDVAKRYKNRSLLLTKKLGFRGEVNCADGRDMYYINLYPDENYYPVPEGLKDLRMTVFLSGEQIDYIRENKACFKLMIKEGLNLVADIFLVK